jgi:hypothetical protein
MRRNRLRAVAMITGLVLAVGCNFASTARDTIATSYGYIIWAQATYGAQCRANPNVAPCTTITKGIGLHNAAVDALSAYCSGPPTVGQQSWTAGGPCSPIKTLQSALQASITTLSPLIADLRLLASGKAQPKATAAMVLRSPNTMASLEWIRVAPEIKLSPFGNITYSGVSQ